MDQGINTSTEHEISGRVGTLVQAPLSLRSRWREGGGGGGEFCLRGGGGGGPRGVGGWGRGGDPPPPAGDRELLEVPKRFFGLNRLAPKEVTGQAGPRSPTAVLSAAGNEGQNRERIRVVGREEKNCSAGGWGGDTEAHFPNPPPSLLGRRDRRGGVQGGGARPAVPGGAGVNPTSMAQNDTHVALIVFTTQMWGGELLVEKTFSGQNFVFLCLWRQHPFLHKTKGPTRNPISPTPPLPPSAGVHVTPPPPPQSNFQVALLQAPVREILQIHTPVRTGPYWSRQTQHGLGVSIWMHLVNGAGSSPSLGQPTPEWFNRVSRPGAPLTQPGRVQTHRGLDSSVARGQ